jgi:hypothetical protein
LAKSFEDSPTIPDARRRAMGPVVVIECFEEIPCDPCHDACNQGAIETFDDINGLPTALPLTALSAEAAPL